MYDVEAVTAWLTLSVQLLPVLWLIIAVETRYFQSRRRGRTHRARVANILVIGAVFLAGWASFCLGVFIVAGIPPNWPANLIVWTGVISAFTVGVTGMFAAWGLIEAALETRPPSPPA